MVAAPGLVEDGATDPETRVTLERDAALRVETVHRVDEADERSRLDVVATDQRTRRHPHPPRDRCRERRVLLDERATRCTVPLAAACPELTGVHARPPSSRPSARSAARCRGELSRSRSVH